MCYFLRQAQNNHYIFLAVLTGFLILGNVRILWVVALLEACDVTNNGRHLGRHLGFACTSEGKPPDVQS